MPRNSPYRAFTVGATQIVSGGTAKTVALIQPENNQTDRRLLKLKTLKAAINITATTTSAFLGWVAFYKVPRGVDPTVQKAINFPYYFKRTPVAVGAPGQSGTNQWIAIALDMEGLNVTGNDEVGVILNNASSAIGSIPNAAVQILAYGMETS